MKAAILMFALTVVTIPAAAEPLAFPGAEGAGRYALGGRGGDVYHVTNLDNDGPGSLRYGLDTAASPRTIVFDVNGNIHLTSNLSVGSNITIAGQTAPGHGITLCDRQTSVQGHDIIIRYIRCRPGDTFCPDYEPDGLGIVGGTNVIIDHVSASWGIDEVLSATHDSDNVTVQWSLITEALHNSCHSKGNHGYGSLINGGDITFHHNLYAHNRSRNPRPGTSANLTMRLDFVNNIIFNPGDRFGYGSGEPGNPIYLNYVGNYGISGLDTTSSDLYLADNADTHIYQAANKMDTNKNRLLDGTDRGWGAFAGPETQHSSRFDLPPVTTQTADDAYASVLELAGASLHRDPVDARIIQTVISQNGHHIDSPADVGGWPDLATAPAPPDTDRDGMPDAWENANDLNPANPDDRNGDADGDGYTNLEDYLDWLCTVGSLNQPPAVDAGPDQTVWLSQSGTPGEQTVYLDGVVSDDGLPGDPIRLVLQWTQVDNGAPEPEIRYVTGPIDLAVTFTERGTYAFTLTANDGYLQTADTVVVFVGGDPCDASHLSTQTPYNPADLNRDCIVNLDDIALFCADWLNCTDRLTACR